ncbi:hypothetical protein EDD16DRAFT_1709264 [Pisolithus croceorrhizus]|nr:hypothetical protein EDD16DRAFT_1709261 [Pisolithus croceorrhizus]KAI6114610.1 hypothetical protein EDD16DRAFT_1709264 [Pisolithus croceorrhizus]KAI6146610.1 hypothetical protein EDD17DRAFT_1767612 [Pisolithus thermaeus]KAI6146615.1 hypothetical protein EDD17DRAFT_1767615 [Pisolithus thermaeus]
MAQNTAFVAVFSSGIFDASRGDGVSEIGAVNDEDGKLFVIIVSYIMKYFQSHLHHHLFLKSENGGIHDINDGHPGAQFPRVSTAMKKIQKIFVSGLTRSAAITRHASAKSPSK